SAVVRPASVPVGPSRSHNHSALVRGIGRLVGFGHSCHSAPCEEPIIWLPARLLRCDAWMLSRGTATPTPNRPASSPKPRVVSHYVPQLLHSSPLKWT